MKLNRQQKELLKETYVMWNWLAKTGKYKEDYHRIKYFINVEANCGFCHIWKGENCPLCFDYDCEFSFHMCCNGIFLEWTNAEYESKEKKKYAKQIKNLIKTKLKELGVYGGKVYKV